MRQICSSKRSPILSLSRNLGNLNGYFVSTKKATFNSHWDKRLELPMTRPLDCSGVVRETLSSYTFSHYSMSCQRRYHIRWQVTWHTRIYRITRTYRITGKYRKYQTCTHNVLRVFQTTAVTLSGRKRNGCIRTPTCLRLLMNRRAFQDWFIKRNDGGGWQAHLHIAVWRRCVCRHWYSW